MELKKILYVLAIAGTDLINHQGISAAGANHEMLKFTAALDAEFIVHGKTLSHESMPLSPSGICSPALIAKACLNLLDSRIVIINLGAHIKPLCDQLQIYLQQSKDISQEDALSQEEFDFLYRAGFDVIDDLNFNPKEEKLVLAECLVGGTTTAFAVLKALGYACDGLVSSSFPHSNHALKNKLITQMLARIKAPIENVRTAIVRSGDALQAFCLGFGARSRKENFAIELGGGSQMLAIKTLMDREFGFLESVSIAPSPWILNDISSDFFRLHQLCSPQTKIISAKISAIANHSDLAKEIHQLAKIRLENIIEQYNLGHVKEGLGLGSLLANLIAQ